MRPTVLLFDIDGTLVTTGGVGRRALERTFERRYGRTDACKFRLDGMTDRAIFRQGLLAIGEKADDAAVDAIIDDYLTLLVDEVASAPVANYRLHPGMRRAVELAVGRRECAVGLGTGNVRPGAKIKLDRVEIFEQFRFGGFGCDHEDRTELIRTGATRGAQMLHAPLSECRVVVIGDTPKDVAAAKGIGAECVGVGTGAFTPAQLIAAGADAAYENLEADGAIGYLLGS
jgi:phosphoglycolate phosphatase